MSDSFSGLPKLVNSEVVLVLVDANNGTLLNLDGSQRSKGIINYELDYFKIFQNKQDAGVWANTILAKNSNIMCILFDKDYSEEYIA